MNIFEAINKSLRAYRADKWIGVFSLVPILLGILFYYFLGSYLYGDLLNQGKTWIDSTLSSGGWSSFFYYLMAGLLTIGFYFLLSWTFVLLVAGVASPFNDLISNRVEKVLREEVAEELGESFARLWSRLSFTLINEAKKILFILFVSLLALILSFIPILAPVSVILSALLMAVSFLDYSWSRKDLPFKSCVSDVRRHFLSYALMGGVFLALLTIPVVNLFALPFGVVYFTVLQVSLNGMNE